MNGSIESPHRMPIDVSLRPADVRDERAVRRLLHESALPLEGVEEFFPTAYVVAVSRAGGIVGVAGLETHGSDGLLRSVAVAPATRGKGIGETLVRDRLGFAREHGLEAVHLLTTTAARWFDRLGFRRADRDALPAAIRESVEFGSACPESATAMSRPVSDASELREEIRARYASAAQAARSGPSSCCGSGSSCGGASERRAPAGLALRPEGLGYDAADVASLPDEAVQASLGCGNPLLLAELREGERVLDLGSGGGIDVLLSARRVGPRGWAWGVDMTDEMLSLARENQRAAGVENATFLRGTIEAVPLPDASVDVVISNCVINLSTDKAKTIAEAYRVLEPGGRFAVADIVTTHPMPPAAREAVALWAGCVAGAMTIDEYRQVLADAGFVDVEIEPVQAVGGDSACCGAEDRAPELAAWDGKVLSAFVRAMKPGEMGRAKRNRAASVAATLAWLAMPLAANGAPGDAERVREQARGTARAMEWVEHLSEEIGPRLTGSRALERASAWAKDRFEAFGLERVRFEDAGTFPVGFDRERSTGEMIAPERKTLRFGTPAWTAGTRGAVRGLARRAPADASLAALQAKALRGAWVLVPRPVGTAPGHAALLQSLQEIGVAGLVFPAAGDRIVASGDPNVSWDALPSVPIIDLYESEWNDVARRVDAGESVSLSFDLRHRFTKGPRELVNVVAEIPGARRPEELVVVGAHLDSWDAASGATDNAVGCAATLEAARLLASAGVRPDRTIRFVLFTGEEQGLIGSTAYVAAHGPELARTSAVLILDGGAGAISGLQVPAALAADIESILAPVRALDATRPLEVAVGPTPSPQLAACSAACAPSAACTPGPSCTPSASCASACAPGAGCASDHWSFVQAGVPAFLWRQAEGPSAYAVTHHTDLDRIEHVRAADVEHSARVVALAALGLADHARLLPRQDAAVPAP